MRYSKIALRSSFYTSLSIKAQALYAVLKTFYYLCCGLINFTLRFIIRIMIRQDYFLRLLEEFATALATMMKKKEDERDDSLKDLYRQYVGDYTLLRNMRLSRRTYGVCCKRMEQQREDRPFRNAGRTLYAEGSTKQPNYANMLLEKAYSAVSYM